MGGALILNANGRLGVCALVAVLGVLAAHSHGTAQRRDDAARGFWSDPQGEFFFHGTVGVPVGEFGRHVDLGGGGGFGGVLFLNRDRMVALRAEGNFLIYGSEAYDAPLSTTIPVDVTVRTTNSILSAGMGPQIYILTGALRPYIFGTFGFSYFLTETSVRGRGAEEPLTSRIDFDDFIMALNAGGGLSTEVYGAEFPSRWTFQRSTSGTASSSTWSRVTWGAGAWTGNVGIGTEIAIVDGEAAIWSATRS